MMRRFLSVCAFFKMVGIDLNKRKPLQKGKLNVEYMSIPLGHSGKQVSFVESIICRM